MIKLTKLDKRMNGWGWFSHRVDITGPYRDTAIVLYKCRKWLWDTFGPGCEYIILSRINLTYPKKDQLWAWDTEHGNIRIYLSGAALTQFLLMKTKLETIDENL